MKRWSARPVIAGNLRGRRLAYAAGVGVLSASVLAGGLHSAQAAPANPAAPQLAAFSPAAQAEAPFGPQPGSWQRWIIDQKNRYARTRPKPEHRPRWAHLQPNAQSVLVVSDELGVLRAPERVRAGRTTFDVSADMYAGLILARPVDGYTLEQLQEDLESTSTRQSRARLKYSARFGGGATSIARRPGQFSTTLYPGRYWLFDPTWLMVFGTSRVHTLTVQGPERQEPFPRVSGIVRERADGLISTSPSIRGKGDVLVVNDGDKISTMFVARLKSGRTLRDFRQWVRRPSRYASPLDIHIGAQSAPLGPRTSYIWQVNLPRGRYIVSTDTNDDIRHVRTLWLR